MNICFPICVRSLLHIHIYTYTYIEKYIDSYVNSSLFDCTFLLILILISTNNRVIPSDVVVMSNICVAFAMCFIYVTLFKWI